jgi:hypothetical protein
MASIPLLALALSLSSCGGDDTPMNITINFQDIQVSDLLVNTPWDTTLVITNEGGTALRVFDISVSHPSNIIIDVETPFVVNGGEESSVTISLLLTTSISLRDTVVIVSSDEDTPEIRIPVVLTTRSYARVQSGWQKFEADDFVGATTDFSDAVTLDTNYADAYMGHGWCLVKLDQLSTALMRLTTAVALNGGSTAYAGKAFADLNLGNHSAAVSDVDSVVTISGGTASAYTFVHDTSITERDLVWIKARAHYLQGQFAEAQIAVNVLAPGNGLDPLSPTYEADLAALIESLRPIV